jgi:putative thiamine transport system permease protein
LLRLFPLAAFLVLIAPVAAGLAGILLPAFDYLPALGRNEPSLEAFRQLLAAPGLARSVLLSLVTGLVTTAAAFAIVTLFIAGWLGTRLFSILRQTVSPLLSVPHAAAAFGLAFLIAPSGFLFRLLSGWVTGSERPPDLLIVHDRLGLAMTVGLIVKEIPFLLLMSLAALPQTRAPEMLRMTAALGYGRAASFLYGVMPQLYRQVRYAVFAALAFSTSVVDVALILGPTTPAPLAVRILEWQRDPALAQHVVAAAGAVLQIGVTLLALAIWLVGERAVALVWRGAAGGGLRLTRDSWLRSSAAVLMTLAATVFVCGIVLLALWSVASPWRYPHALPTGLTFKTWMRLIDDAWRPLAHTLAFAAASSIAAVVLALGLLEFAARAGRTRARPVFEALYTPLIVPQVSFLFGLQVLFAYGGFDGAFLTVLLVHLVFVFPYVLLSLAEPWWSWDPRYGHAVRALGRGPNTVFWRVRLPMLSRAALTAAALGFAISVGLYLPTLLIGAGRWPTITTETVALSSGGDPRLIGATALLQALLPFLGFAVAAALAGRLPARQRSPASAAA